MTYSWILISLLVFINKPQSKSSSISSEQMENPNPLTSHILDTAQGIPAHKLNTKLYKWDHEAWRLVANVETNEDGRLPQRVIGGKDWTVGRYKIYFDTKTYFERFNMKTFYPYIEIVFEIEKPADHYHVPLILSPYGYSTYRGS